MSASSSVPASTTVWFVSGGSRGIGFGVVDAIAVRPNTLVYATARDPPTAYKLQELAARRSNVRVLQLSAASDAEHAAAVKLVQAEAGRVDVLLANAGIASVDALQRTDALDVDKLREHFEVNTVGVVRLFTALAPLLARSARPKFVVVSTVRGSLGLQGNYAAAPGTIYGLSKAAVNFFTLRVHVEHPHLIAFPLQPGWVQTDMGNAVAVASGKEKALVTVEESVAGITRLIDEATRETHGGKFWNAIDGKELPW